MEVLVFPLVGLDPMDSLALAEEESAVAALMVASSFVWALQVLVLQL